MLRTSLATRSLVLLTALSAAPVLAQSRPGPAPSGGWDPTTRAPLRPLPRVAAPAAGAARSGVVVGYTTDEVVPHTYELVELGPAASDLEGLGYTLVPITELSAQALEHVDILYVGLVTAEYALSAAQVDVVEDFVLGGGRLVFIGENFLFFENNTAVGGRFGFVYPEFSFQAAIEDSIDDVTPHPITEGPHGTVSFIDGVSNGCYGFGSMTDVGPHGTNLLTFDNGNSGGAVIEPGTLSPGSGAVATVPEVNIFRENYDRGDNRAFWLNMFAYSGLTTLDFETEDDFVTPLANGQAIASPATFGNLVAIAGQGPSTVGAAVFDSASDGPNLGGPDPDLLVARGNLLILQQDPAQVQPGIYAEPNDALGGGILVFDFLGPVELFSLVLVDICPGPPAQDALVTLFDGTARTRTYAVPGGWTEDVFAIGPPGHRTLALTALDPQPGYRATASAVEMAGFDPRDVVRLEVALASSGAVDDLCFRPQMPPTDGTRALRRASPVGR